MILLCFMSTLNLFQKNNQHRFKDINSKNKVCHAYALPGNKRCIVRRLDTYLSLLPPETPYFHMQMIDKFPSDPKKSVVTKQRVGVNALKQIIPNLSAKAGVTKYTNHSLRAMAITQLFNSRISEKTIADTSGH